MTDTEKMQQLHHRASLGETLSAEENTVLQNWYDELDREEAYINRDNREIDLDTMRENLGKTYEQIAAVSAENVRLFKHSEKLRRENDALRRQIAARFAEQTV